MSHLTVHDVPPELVSALAAEKERRQLSLDQTVITLLSQSLGVDGRRSNGLGRLAGRWSEEQHRSFEEAVAPFDEIDEEIWR